MQRYLKMMVASTLVLSLSLFGAGCSSEDASTDKAGAPAKSAFPVSVTDDAGRDVTIESRPERIVSLAPGNTEIVAELGLLDQLVGVTSFDDYPAQVADIEKVGDFSGPNLEKVAAADPDLVLMTGGVQADVIAQLEDLGATVLVIDPTDVASLYADIVLVGEATGEPEKAAEIVADMQKAESDIAEAIGDAESVPCFIEIAQNPIYTAGPGTLLADLIERAGGTNIVTEQGYVAFSSEQIVAADPDVYFVTKGSMSSPEGIAKRAGFAGLSAVKDGRVVVLDDNLVSRPGPRAIQGLESMARALHPDAF